MKKNCYCDKCIEERKEIDEIEKKKEELSDNEPHTLCEMICINCKSRAYHVYHAETLLKDLECDKCKEAGYLIMTGQEID